MRGKPQEQPEFLTVLNLNATGLEEHPWRAIKRHVDAVLRKLSPLFDEFYAEDGRSSIPPEQLLKARILKPPALPEVADLCRGRRQR